MGYTIMEVEPVEWERIVKNVTFAKAQADVEATRQDQLMACRNPGWRMLAAAQLPDSQRRQE
jgi:hypothetical protein